MKKIKDYKYCRVSITFSDSKDTVVLREKTYCLGTYNQKTINGKDPEKYLFDYMKYAIDQTKLEQQPKRRKKCTQKSK